MDPSFHHQQQHQLSQPYQPSPPLAPSQHQLYAHQTPQSHYAFDYQYNQSQQYPYYPPTQTHYPNAYHQEPLTQEPAPIHPPGVPVQQHPDQPPFLEGPQHGFQQSSYYSHGVMEQQEQPHHQQQQLGYSDPGLPGQQWQGSEFGLIPYYSRAQAGQPQPSAAGRGGAPFRGRGRGKGRSGTTAVPRPPPRMAWCELCRVDCNTSEILEMHKNGKRHKKNLRIQDELQTLAQKTQVPQMSNTQSVPEAAFGLHGNVSGLVGNNQPLEQAVTEENKVPEGQGRGSKRKMKKSGAGGKRAKSNDESTKPTDPLKQKEVIPFICELCNVKCESTAVFDSHLKGKKHQFNVQRFQEHQATLGQAALQALYPALQAALLQLAQPNINASTSTGTTGLDQQVLQWLQAFLPQAGGQSAPAPAPTLNLQPQTLQENAPTEGAESRAKPEIKTEEPNPETAEPTK